MVVEMVLGNRCDEITLFVVKMFCAYSTKICATVCRATSNKVGVIKCSDFFLYVCNFKFWEITFKTIFFINIHRKVFWNVISVISECFVFFKF